MNAVTAEADPGLVESRQLYYETLFQGELSRETPPEDAYVGVASLYRITHKKGMRSRRLTEHLEKIPNIVETVLAGHDIEALEGGDSIFYITSDEDRKLITGVVANIFTRWEVAHSRRGLDPLLPDDLSSGSGLVVETAAAVMNVSGQHGFSLRNNKTDKKNIAIILANWGPEFANQWFNGATLDSWADEREFSPDERDRWAGIFTPSLLKHFAVYYVHNPIKGLDAVRHNLDEVLTDENLAEHLGWTTPEVSEIFTMDLREYLAVHNIANPLQAVARIKRDLEETLTNRNIADHLGCTEEEVIGLTSRSKLSLIAARYPNDPLKVVRTAKRNLDKVLTYPNIAEELGIDQSAVKELFPPYVLRNFALHRPLNPIKACEDWLNGDITLGVDDDATRDRRLSKLREL